MPAPIDITGKRFGRLVAIKYLSSHAVGRVWQFQCDCGKTTNKILRDVTSGHTKSCGCLHREKLMAGNPKHGLSKSHPLWNIWNGIKERCFNPKHQDFKHYGGRGILMCEQWKDFLTFIKDMGGRPSPKHSVDRIDTNKGYSPDNCRWATSAVQAMNKRTNIWIVYKGERCLLMELATRHGFKYGTVYQRYRKGWNADRIFATPTKITNRKALISCFGEERTIAEWSRATGIRFHTLRERIIAGWPAEKALSTTVGKYTRSSQL